jgi:hypothetical protein
MMDRKFTARLWSRGKALAASTVGMGRGAELVVGADIAMKYRREVICPKCREKSLRPILFGLANFGARREATRPEIWACAACGWKETRRAKI